MNEAEHQAIAAAVARQLDEFCGGLESRVRHLASQCNELKGAVEDQASATKRLAKKLQDTERSKDAPTLMLKGGETIDISAVVKMITTAVTEAVMKQVVQVHAQALKRIDQLSKDGKAYQDIFKAMSEAILLVDKKAAGVRWMGVWQPGTKAQKGEFWTEGGSVWHCNEATSERPGNGSNAWTLAVKRGRDGSGHR